MGMARKKIVEVTAISACLKCGNPAFDLEPGQDLDDPGARVRCGKCGHVGTEGEFLRTIRSNLP